MTRQAKLFDEPSRLLERKTIKELEEWLESAPIEWRDRLRYFCALGVPKDKAFVPAWWSLGKEARRAGKLSTLSSLANWLGVSRETLDNWEKQKYGDPPTSLREMGREARIRRMDEFGPDVDAALVEQLEGGAASAAHFKLYYDIIGLTTPGEGTLHLVGAGRGPVAIKRAEELSDDELAAIAAGGGARAPEEEEGA